MDNMMWFGNRNYMQWIKCPASGATYGSEGSSQAAGFRNGGAFRRNSLSAAKTYQLSWSLTKRDNIRAITDYADGVYGPGPIFWSDPFNMDKNVLAQAFATPSLGGYDGTTLDGKDTRPQLVPTSANIYGYPVESAVYVTGASSTDFFKHYVPIPPGYTAWVGAHGGTSSTGGIMVQPTVGPAASGAPTRVAVTSVTTDTRFTNSFTATGNLSGIELSLQAGAGLVTTLAGVMVQVLPTGTTPETGGFISGQGHSGCDWNERPSREAYSAVMDYMGMSASFIETEQWR